MEVLYIIIFKVSSVSNTTAKRGMENLTNEIKSLNIFSSSVVIEMLSSWILSFAIGEHKKGYTKIIFFVFLHHYRSDPTMMTCTSENPRNVKRVNYNFI